MSEDSMGEIYVKVNTKELDDVVKSLGRLSTSINSITSSMAKGLKSTSPRQLISGIPGRRPCSTSDSKAAVLCWDAISMLKKPCIRPT